MASDPYRPPAPRRQSAADVAAELERHGHTLTPASELPSQARPAQERETVPVRDERPAAAAKTSVRMVVSGVRDGYPVTVECDVGHDKVESFFAWLLKKRIKAPVDPLLRSPNDEPYCPRHNVAMQRHSKQNDTWYSHNVGTGERPVWCKGRPGKDSPGWDQPGFDVDHVE